MRRTYLRRSCGHSRIRGDAGVRNADAISGDCSKIVWSLSWFDFTKELEHVVERERPADLPIFFEYLWIERGAHVHRIRLALLALFGKLAFQALMAPFPKSEQHR